MTKKTILHFIYSLGRGGAETMLVRVIKELPEYRNIVVTLNKNNHFINELQCDEFICINKPSLLSLPSAVFSLKKIISKYKPAIVHLHLPQSNFIARLATPKHIPLITTIHTSIATAIDYKKWFIRLLDKFTWHFRSSVIIAVSQGALNDYFSVLKLKPGKHFVLYTFVDPDQYQNNRVQVQEGKFMVVSIGALRKGKNYSYLIEAFKQFKNDAIELHIYGIGPEQESLQRAIDVSGVPIILKGQVNNINEILPQYDLFVMSSMFEGFSLSVLEAMAAKLPLMLSDIVSFNEQCQDCAIYFNLADTDDLVNKLKLVITDNLLLKRLGEKANNRVLNNFTLKHHVKQLKEIYIATLQGT
jgi:glycosyltransferase involved in cell wall biosynthesis